MATITPPPQAVPGPAPPRLEHFPVSFFAMVMGLTGLTLAWEKAVFLFDLPVDPSPALLSLSASVYLVLLTVYLLKLWHYPAAVRAELAHPVKLNFFPAMSISLLLLATASLDLLPVVAHVLFVLGASFHLLITLHVVGSWMHHGRFQIQHLNPAWFIPAVGNVVVPIAGTSLGYVEVSWFFFSIGLVFWLVLLTILFNRMLFHEPLDEQLLPTLFILIAPPAVGFLSWLQLTGGLDAVGRLLFFAALFMTLLLATQVRRFLGLRFYLSWWAYSFPLAAMSLAALAMYEQTGLDAYRYLGAGLVLLLTVIVTMLVLRTALGLREQRYRR